MVVKLAVLIKVAVKKVAVMALHGMEGRIPGGKVKVKTGEGNKKKIGELGEKMKAERDRKWKCRTQVCQEITEEQRHSQVSQPAAA